VTSVEALKTVLKREHRHQVNIAGWIQQKGSLATQQCRVVDISRNGARLEVADSYNVPDDFLLLLSKADAGHPALSGGGAARRSARNLLASILLPLTRDGGRFRVLDLSPNAAARVTC
jgi:hypothetical protein